MTNIEKMIQDMCPNGVEFKKLGDLGVFENTGVDKKSRDDEQEVTLLNFMDVCRHKYIDASVPTMVVTAPDRKIEQCNVLKDDIFITPSSETIDEIGFAAVIMEDLPNVVYSYHIMRYRLNYPNTTTAKFIRYLFEAPVIRKQILKGAKGLTRFGLSKYQFADIEIPLPPLAIQQRIVEVLDRFSALAAELQAELQKRRTQYEYYRTRLLTPPPTENISSDNSTDESKWEWKTLGGLCQIRTGKLNANAQVENGQYPFFTCDAKPFKIDKYAFDTEAILISGNGSQVGHLNYYNGKFNAYQRTYVLDKFSANIFYVLQYLKGTLREYIMDKSRKGSVPYITLPMLQDFPIPLPPLAEQIRIADLLDKFEALTTSLSDGIPAEQAAQQKRYEYYRDLLLTFDRKNV